MNSEVFFLSWRDGLFQALVVLAGFWLTANRARKMPEPVATVIKLLWPIQLGCALAYVAFASGAEADVHYYYQEAANSGMPEGVGGTATVIWLAWPMASWLGLSFFSCFLPFALAGCFGFVLMAEVAARLNIKSTWLMLVLAPNMHFWTSMLGKDAITYLASALLLWSWVGRVRFSGIVCALILIGLIRPHLLILALLVLGIAVMFSRELRASKFVFPIAVVVALAVISPWIASYVGVDSLTDLSAISDRVDVSASYYEGGSSVDMSGLPAPLRWFAFLFRPLFWDAPNVYGMIGSVENAFWLVLCVMGLPAATMSAIRNRDSGLRLSVMLFWAYSLFLGLAGGNNMGLAMRQKVQLMPFLILMMWYVFGRGKRHVKPLIH